jgi:hypothetical protein
LSYIYFEYFFRTEPSRYFCEWKNEGFVSGKCVDAVSDPCANSDTKPNYCILKNGTYIHPLDIKTCEDIPIPCGGNNENLKYPNMFIINLSYYVFPFFLKSDSPQGCLKLNFNNSDFCVGIVVECNLMKNKSMCEIDDSYRNACYWNGDVCQDFLSVTCTKADKNETLCSRVGSCFCYLVLFFNRKCHFISGNCVDRESVKECSDINSTSEFECNNNFFKFYKFCCIVYYVLLLYFQCGD